MKIKSVLLVGIAGFALASCGGVKGYKTEVKHKVFTDNIEKFVEESTLLSADDPFSFTINANSKSNTKTTYFKNGKSISEEKMEIKSETSCEFDSANSVLRSKGVYETREEDASDVKTEKYDGDIVNQCDNKNFYEVDMKSKIYKKSASSKPADAVAAEASKAIKALGAFIAQMSIFDDAKYYIDGNVYTCELNENEEDEESTRTGKTVYQLVAGSDKIELYSESKVTLKKLNFTEVITDNSSYVLKKKNVKLNNVNLDNYLDGSKGFDDSELENVVFGSSFLYGFLFNNK
ncbi:MAG: hypothetical protein MJ222_01210 [Bacilli bacterium]|nr:hypothetical protein [Bacilli bacterium]